MAEFTEEGRAEAEWYIVGSDGQTEGPFLVEAIKNKLTPETFVWKNGMPNWMKARETDLNVLFPEVRKRTASRRNLKRPIQPQKEIAPCSKKAVNPERQNKSWNRSVNIFNLSLQGRLDRLEFLVFLGGVILLMLFFYVLADGLLPVLVKSYASNGVLATAVRVIGTRFFAMLWFAAMVRRCHDIGLPGWSLIAFDFVTGVECVTFASVSAISNQGIISITTLKAVWLLLWPGQAAANEYGPVSLETQISDEIYKKENGAMLWMGWYAVWAIPILYYYMTYLQATYYLTHWN